MNTFTQMLARKIALRIRYWARRLSVAFGVCPDCRNSLNFTRNGIPVCLTCGSRK
jgi:predicted amidophosphoribosyltransferase